MQSILYTSSFCNFDSMYNLIEFIGLHRGFVFSTGYTLSVNRQTIIGLISGRSVSIISEFSWSDSRLGNFIIETMILTAQQEFICLSC